MSEPVDARRQRFEDAITAFAKARRAKRPVSFAKPKDIGRLAGADRAFMLRSAVIANLSHHYAENPNADCAAGVLVISTLLSDNDEGCCTLSIGTIAKLLSRHPRNVMEARQRCEAEKVLFVDRDSRPGQSARCWPAVGLEQIKDPTAPAVWIVSALAGDQPRQGRPRQKKPLHTGVQGFSENPCIPVSKTPAYRYAPDITKRTSLSVCGASPPHTPQGMTQDWMPSAETTQWAKERLAISDAQLEAKARKFRSHALAKPRRVTDWEAGFRDWLAKDFPERSPQQIAPAAPTPERQRLWMTGWLKFGHWPVGAGPRPGEAGCQIEPEILAEFRNPNGRAA